MVLQGHGLSLAYGPDRLPEVRVRVLHQPAHQARTDVLHVLLPAPLQVLIAELPDLRHIHLDNVDPDQES